ncbi:MAG: VanZ family protein [Acidobacteria bacterium]|nr:VanZ family protein [Acidobacteriota bacterium]
MPVALHRLPLWVWWIPVVWIASFPIGLTADPQWHRISLVPFTDPADKILDLGVNLLMFIPFGYSFAARPGGLLRLMAAAALTSISAELLQLFSTIRYPSCTDVVYAVVGALIGAAVRLWVVRAREAG